MSTYDKYKFYGDKSDFTMTLGEVIAAGYDDDEKLHLDKQWYPLYDEAHRAELNEKIVSHFVLREIGYETIEQFIYMLGVTMRENAPWFNERYKAAELLRKSDPLNAYDVWTDNESGSESQASSRASGTQDGTTSGTTDSTQSSKTRSRGYDSDVPATGVVDDFARYASHATESEADTEGESHSEQSSQSHSTTNNVTDFSHESTTGKGKSHTSGRMSSATQLARDYANAVMNVDMEIIAMLERLFMQVVSTRDTIYSNDYYW